MKKLLLSMFVVVAMCATSTVLAQDNTKKEGSCCKAKTECADKKKADKKEGCCADKKATAGTEKKACCSDKKEGTASTDKKACCSAKKATTADNKSAGKK